MSRFRPLPDLKTPRRGLTSHHRRRLVPWNAWCRRTLDGVFGKSWRERHLAALLKVVWLINVDYGWMMTRL